MAERNVYNILLFPISMNKRVCFARGNQKKFIKYLKEKSSLEWKELAKKFEINENTLSKSYQFELCDIPYAIFKKIISFLGNEEATILKKYNAKINEEKLVIGRKVFGEQKKVLDTVKINFKSNNLKLIISDVEYSKSDLEKGIKIPTLITPELAEEIGMHFGDGFLSERRYDYRLKGNQIDEREYYICYIAPLFKKLYNLDVKLKDFDRSFGFEISSKGLWGFKTKVIGIKPGKKYGITFPEVLKINNIKILGAFLRGLFDTDGSLSFKTKYGYRNYYPEITLALTSKNLIKDVAGILFMLGFNPCVYFNEKYGIITIYGVGAFKKYETLINWSSTKNLNKVNEWKMRYPQLYNMADVVQRSVSMAVARGTRVRLPASALAFNRGEKWQ